MTKLSTAGTALNVNDTIGILGGGQLGRMLAMAAAKLGLKSHIYCPHTPSPASEVAAAATTAPYDDENALLRFLQSVDVITYEFENVPVETVAFLTAQGATVRPGALALEKAQDRLEEKIFINEIGAATATFHPVDNLKMLEEGLKKVGRPALLKTRRLGYDGKGQTTLQADTADLADSYAAAVKHAWAEVGAAPSILEGFVNFEKEISVIGARSAKGDIELYDCAENVHQDGILKISTSPAAISEATLGKAQEIAKSILSSLGYIGVIGVEFFVLKDGNVIVNEIAPRVHNSGHWTQDACAVSQFEQHIRAIAGWPLGSPARHSQARMENLLGEDIASFDRLIADRDLCVHLYGKAGVRPGRKMGHVTKLSYTYS